jgi:hypothetical protein
VSITLPFVRDRRAGSGHDPAPAPPSTPRSAPPVRAGTAVVIAVLIGVSLTAAFVAAVWKATWLRLTLGRVDPYVGRWLFVSTGALVVVAALGARRGRTWRAGRLRVVGPGAALVASMLAYVVPVASASARGQWWGMVGGAVPFSDPHLYFGGAERLLLFGHLDTFNSRRPLNAMFLAVRLAVTHLDLRMAFVLQAVILGAACWLAARAVARDLGPAAGLALFVAVFNFARVYVPTPMSEALGVTFGALALALVWHAVRTRRAALAVMASFVLTVALDARSGALLLAVAVPLWLARHLRTSGLLEWRVLAGCGLAVAVGVSLNYASVAALGGDVDNIYGNGGFLVYGLARGKPSWDLDHPSWVQIYIDHPEVVSMTDPQRNRFILDRAREELRAHPGRFVGASVQSERNYLAMAKRLVLRPLSKRWHRLAMAVVAFVAAGLLLARWRRWGMVEALADLGLLASTLVAVPVLTSMVPSNRPPFWLGAALATVAFGAFGVVGSRRLGSPVRSLVVVVGAAAAACVPVLGVDTVRVFAASAPLLSLPLVLAVAVLTRGLGAGGNGAPTRSTHSPQPADRLPPTRIGDGWWPVLAAGALVAALALGTPLAMASVGPPATTAVRCPDGRPAEPLIGGTGLRLVDDRPGSRHDIDQVRLGDLARQLPLFATVPANHLATVTASTSFIDGLTVTGQDRFAVVDGNARAPRTSALYLCGDVRDDGPTDAVKVYFPEPFDFFHGVPVARR